MIIKSPLTPLCQRGAMDTIDSHDFMKTTLFYE